MKRILILNLMPNSIGDSILFLPFFKILRKNFPNSYILATADKVAVELWKENKEINKILEINELTQIGNRSLSKIKKIFIYIKMLTNLTVKLRSYKFEMCFVVYPNLFFLPLMPWFLGIKERIGYTYKGSYISFLLTKKTASKLSYDGYYDTHIMESYLDLLRAANISFSNNDTVCRKNTATKDIKSIKKILKKIGIKKNRLLICFHTKTKVNWRDWPIQMYKQLIQYLVKKHNTYIFLLGSKNESKYNQQLVSIDKGIYNMCGKLSLSEVGALLSISDLFIGNDSGLAHYSSSVGTKTLAIFGTSSPIQAGPRGHGETICIFNTKQENTLNFLRRSDLEADLKIMRSIKLSQVIKETEKLLKK